MSGPVLVLVGPPGAGKTTVGRLLADRLGVAFRDTDTDVEAAAGKSIPDLFFEEGEEGFRVREREAVRTALAEHDGVLSLGGGAVLAGDTRAALAGRRVVFLETGLGALVERVGLNKGRPLVGLNPRATLKAMLEQRLPLYAQVATQTVSTDGKTPEQVADEVLA